jgi:predicted lysophospholipase L1 biosynthesis ABC-type transport system permease subunit
VTGSVQPPPVGGSDLVGDAGVVTAEGFAAIAPGTPMITAAVDLRPGAAAGAPLRIAERLGMTAGSDAPPAIVNLGRVRRIPYLVAGVVGALATLSLVHQMVGAVRRRRVDLAILRAFGATRRWLTGVVHWQATIITAVVLVIGIPLGTAAGNSIYRAFVDRTGARTDVVIPLGGILAAGLVLLMLANVAAAVPARRARRLPPDLLSCGGRDRVASPASIRSITTLASWSSSANAV